jgi:hypothetical protein
MTSNFFSPLSFVAVFGSGIRDPGSGMGKNQDPGSGINIPDPQHCTLRTSTSTPQSGSFMITVVPAQDNSLVPFRPVAPMINIQVHLKDDLILWTCLKESEFNLQPVSRIRIRIKEGKNDPQ